MGDTFEVLKGKKNLPTENAPSSKAVLQKWTDEDFPRKQKLKQFFTIRSVVQKMLEEVLQAEMKGC